MDNNYEIISELGVRHDAVIYEAKHKETNKLVALKYIKGKHAQEILNEIDSLNRLKNFHVVGFEDFYTNIKIPNENERGTLLILERVTNGELYDYIFHTGSFNETLSRTYFKQLISAISEVHLKRIVHRNIRLQSALLDEKYNLKLGDFSFSVTINEEDPVISGEVGSHSYLAPEVFSCERYNGYQAEIWSVGVFLFYLLFGKLPFEKACKFDWHFRQIQSNNYERFWAKHLSNNNNNISDETKNFLNLFFKINPNERITIEQIVNHSWFNGHVVNDETRIHELSRRKEEIKLWV